ncbi:MAG TPA: spermidine/putrescine ABC transporter permease, partial [Clostridiaceae bacterium]|nr:spermidine/putrescine ABC transporter permease [Clostridiaceae bacterium]
MRKKFVLKDLLRSLKDTLGITATILPAALWMLGFFVIPLILVVAVSFCTRGEVGDIVYSFTLKNYAKLINPLYISIFIKSMAIALFTTMLCLVFGYPFAFIVAKANKKIKPLLLVLVML